MNEKSDKASNKSFAELMDGSFAAPAYFEPGQQVEAKVIRISGNTVFLDIGGKSEGYVEKDEFLDPSGELTVKEGDKVSAYFVSSRKSEMLFTTKLGSGQAAQSHLEDACANGIPVEGTVVKEIKGGYEVTLGGGVRSFCPYSQMDVKRIEDPESMVGKNLTFLINTYEEGGRNIVLSRRKILEEERRQRKEELKETLEVGQVVTGQVMSIRKFGAFIDIGGLEGLLPVSEIGWGHVEDIHSRLEVGQTVEVAVTKLDWENDRFSFSLKQTLPDPWETAVKKFPEGSFQTGKVARLATFGAFVTLAEGVDGLLHISSLAGGRKINHPREVVREGDTVEVKIDGIDLEKRRISLSLAEAVRAQEAEANEERKVRTYLDEMQEGSEGSMGTLGDLLKKKLTDG